MDGAAYTAINKKENDWEENLTATTNCEMETGKNQRGCC